MFYILCKSKTLSPATSFHIKLEVTDPNGLSDINSTIIKFYTSTDTNESPDSWDHVTLDLKNTHDGDGCVTENNYRCYLVDANKWTTKFKPGNAHVFGKVTDLSDVNAYYLLENGIVVEQLTSLVLDTTTISYVGSPDTNNNPFLSSLDNNYFRATNAGNVDFNLLAAHTALVFESNSIPASNIHDSNREFFFPDDNSFVNIDMLPRGTYPTSTSNTYDLYLDIPANTPTGVYTGTLSVNASS